MLINLGTVLIFFIDEGRISEFLKVPKGEVASLGATECGEVWGDYCAAAFLPPDARFDVISVQGFARAACLRRAVQLLRPQGGLLVLPQAQRPGYRVAAAEAVPAHWLRFNDSHALGDTLVWMSLGHL